MEGDEARPHLEQAIVTPVSNPMCCDGNVKAEFIV